MLKPQFLLWFFCYIKPSFEVTITMKKSFLPIIMILCLSLMSTQCEEEKASPTQADEEKELLELKTQSEALASTSTCNENTTCKFIAFGSKPCGGPWSYLIYSTSIDVQTLEDLVERYNKKEADFNNKWGMASDCSVVTPPSSVKCENNTCIAEY